MRCCDGYGGIESDMEDKISNARLVKVLYVHS